MPKTLETNRQKIDLALYVRGKRQTPSVSYSFEPGLRRDIEDSSEFAAFQNAAEALTKKLFEVGELRYPSVA